jgi:hypothetical protein
MEKLRLWLALALGRQVLKYVALPYALAAIALGLYLVSGPAGFAAVGRWIFIASLALHGLLTVNAAFSQAGAAELERQGRYRRPRSRSERAQPLEGDPELAQLQESLKNGFASIKSGEGLKALQELVYEFTQLQPILGRRRETDPLAVAHIPALAEETYRQGLSVLEDALDLVRSVDPPDMQRLGAEITELEKEIESLRRDPTQERRQKIREERLASHKERLEMMKQQQLRVDELLHQSDRCGASLHRTRMELAALKADSSEESVNAVTATLRLTINQAKGVQEELKRLGA